MRATIVCPVCGGVIGPHFQVLDHATCRTPSDAAVQPDAPSLVERFWGVHKRVTDALTATTGARGDDEAAPDTTPADREG
jgi:hypothetical protein